MLLSVHPRRGSARCVFSRNSGRSWVWECWIRRHSPGEKRCWIVFSKSRFSVFRDFTGKYVVLSNVKFCLISGAILGLVQQLDAEDDPHPEVLQRSGGRDGQLFAQDWRRFLREPGRVARPRQGQNREEVRQSHRVQIDLTVLKLCFNVKFSFRYLQLGLKKHHYLPMVHKPTRVHMARKEWHKWLVPSYMYSKKFFPQFLSGSGYLVSKKASRCLLEKSKVSFKNIKEMSSVVSVSNSDVFIELKRWLAPTWGTPFILLKKAELWYFL